MRAAFTVELPRGENKNYPTDMEVLDYLRSFGWELIDRQTNNTELSGESSNYIFQANNVIAEMPEAAVNEIDYVIFHGFQHDYQIPFLVSRMVPSQITFRFLCYDLAALQASIQKTLKLVTQTQINGKDPEISNDEVIIFQPHFQRANTLSTNQSSPHNRMEHHYMHESSEVKIMLVGRVVTNAWAETRQEDRQDFVLFGFAIVVLVILLLAYYRILSLVWLESIMQELLIVAITTILVSTYGILQTYLGVFIRMRYHEFVVWKNTSGESV